MTTTPAPSTEGDWTRGGDGSHWADCHETHWDCALAHKDRELTALREALEGVRAENENQKAKIERLTRRNEVLKPVRVEPALTQPDMLSLRMLYDPRQVQYAPNLREWIERALYEVRAKFEAALQPAPAAQRTEP